jgi:hypothetical protein
MTRQQLHQHKLDRARKQGDKAAVAILEGGREYTPDPETPMLTARLLCACGGRHFLSAHRLAA